MEYFHYRITLLPPENGRNLLDKADLEIQNVQDEPNGIDLQIVVDTSSKWVIKNNQCDGRQVSLRVTAVSPANLEVKRISLQCTGWTLPLIWHNESHVNFYCQRWEPPYEMDVLLVKLPIPIPLLTHYPLPSERRKKEDDDGNPTFFISFNPSLHC